VSTAGTSLGEQPLLNAYRVVNATTRDFDGLTHAMSFARLVLAASQVEKLLPYPACPLPPKERAVALAQVFVGDVLSIYPILSDTAVFGALESAYQQEGHYCPPQEQWITHMVLAIALMMQSEICGDFPYEDGLRHMAGALEHAELVLKPGSIASLQAALLLTLFSMLDPIHFNHWYVLGVASRLMADVGLHLDPPKGLQVRPSLLQLRRQVFYSVYALDRYSPVFFLPSLSLHSLT
jgi:hypothetical protein